MIYHLKIVDAFPNSFVRDSEKNTSGLNNSAQIRDVVQFHVYQHQRTHQIEILNEGR